MKLPIAFSLIALALNLQFDMHINNDAIPTNKLRLLNETKLQSFDEIYHIMTLKVCVGLPSQCFNLLYDTGMMYTVVGDARANNSNFEHKFDSSQSQSYRSVNSGIYTFAYRYGTLNAREVCDYVLIGEKKPPYTFNFDMIFNADDSFIGFQENINLYGESWLTLFVLSIIFVALVITYL